MSLVPSSFESLPPVYLAFANKWLPFHPPLSLSRQTLENCFMASGPRMFVASTPIESVVTEQRF